MVVPGAINKDKKPVAASSTAVASTANNCPAIVVSAESETGRNSATGVTDNTAGWEQEAAAAQPFNWDDDEVGAAATGEEEQLHRAHTRRSCWSMPAWLISGMLRVAGRFKAMGLWNCLTFTDVANHCLTLLLSYI